MGLGDWISRRFATKGKNPPFKEDEPLGFGEGIIRRLHLIGQSSAYRYEKHIGDNRKYMNIYLADPIIRTLIDLPCLYAVKDGYDIVTDDEDLRNKIQKLFVDITKAIAKIKQENSADVEKRISENVNMIAIRQAAMKGDTEAIAKVEAFEKKAREEAYTEVSATLIELERLRESVSKQLSGWGRPNISQQQQPQRQ